MIHWECLAEETREVKIGRHMVPAVIRIEASDDSESIQGGFDYGSESENEKEYARFRSGELVSLCLRVTATAEGESGSDVLGACFVTSANAKNELLAMAADYGMESTAITELGIVIIDKARKLLKYAEAK